MYFTAKTNHLLYQLRRALIGTIPAQKTQQLETKVARIPKTTCKRLLKHQQVKPEAKKSSTLKTKNKSTSSSILSVPEKLKSLIFEMPIIPQTLIINNSRTTKAKSINRYTIRKLIEYYLKTVLIKAMLNAYSYHF